MRHAPRIDFLFALAALAFGLYAGWIDLHNTEPQSAALLLIIFGFIFGFVRSRSAWRWAIILGLSLFLADVIFPVFGVKPIVPAEPNQLATLIALIPAFIGTCAGVLMHQATSSGLNHDQK